MQPLRQLQCSRLRRVVCVLALHVCRMARVRMEQALLYLTGLEKGGRGVIIVAFAEYSVSPPRQVLGFEYFSHECIQGGLL